MPYQNPLDFINRCIKNNQVYWTHHVSMRLSDRSLDRGILIRSYKKFEIIESYPEDKYLPSFLIYTRHKKVVFHLLVAVDFKNQNIRVITAYSPNPQKWNTDFKSRSKKP